MTDGSAIAAVEKLDDIIHNSGSRKKFKNNPESAMRDAGADPGEVPPEVWDTLTQMSLDELTAIADLGVALSDTGWLGGKIAWHHVV